jgi:hypothetical protein
MRPHINLLLLSCAVSIPLELAASPASAYIGPGAGLSYLGTALAMVVAFAVSTMYLLMSWLRAVKTWFQRRGNNTKKDGNSTNDPHEEEKR